MASPEEYQWYINHPLTDDKCQSIAVCYPYNKHLDIEDCGHLTDMRCAADWQLEQVIEWIEKKRGGSMRLHSSEINSLVIDLKKAMRPQQQEDTTDD